MTSAAHADAAAGLSIGEGLSVPERVIVSPASGTFRRLDDAGQKKVGDRIAHGDLIGLVHSLGTATPVRSAFGGVLVQFIASDGERLRPGQAVAWLRTAVSGHADTSGQRTSR
jgi:biotin carboxyl carrier protein